MVDPDYQEHVFDLVGHSSYRPLTIKAIARLLRVPSEDYAEFRKLLKRLVKQGRLGFTKQKTVCLVQKDTREPSGDLGDNPLIGTFRRNARGFGFVRPQGTSDRAEDIFIPIQYTSDAANGDSVAYRLIQRRRTQGSNREGRILKILERASEVFVGTYFEREGNGFVRVDGSKFVDPIYVGDPGAKGAQPEDKVVFEMVHFPTPEAEGEGVVTEVLGDRGAPGVDTLMVLRAFNIPVEFDESVLKEARRIAQEFESSTASERLDLREIPTITIDPTNARDFDDAISLSRNPGGFWELSVHVADVSWFVEEGSLLDHEARKRGNSVYLPGLVVPMLPEILSNSLASLQEGKTRYTMSALLEFNQEGIQTSARFARSMIRVDHRFTYERAFDAMMDPDRPMEGIEPEFRTLLNMMLELAMVLRRRRFAKGALQLNMPEVEVDFGSSGEVVGAHLEHDDKSHQVIEEFMLAANEAVANHLVDREVSFLRRGHDDPEPEKLRDFATFVRTLGYAIDLPQSRFELQRVLDESSTRPERQAIHFALLRSLKRADYTADSTPHYALAIENYTHFTSPIRRYPDLMVHRALWSTLIGKRPQLHFDELVGLGEYCTKTERRADSAEQELIKIKLLTYLSEHLGRQFSGVIIGVEDFGLFCQLDEVPAEGLVSIDTLKSDYYDLSRETYTLVGRRHGKVYRLGDQVDLLIWRVNVDRRELDLVMVEDAERLPKPSGSSFNEPHSKSSPSRTPRRGRASVGDQARSGRPKTGHKKKGKGRRRRS